MVSEQTLKCLGQAGSNGRAPLILMPQQNLNPSYWCIWCTKNHLKETRIEKVMDPQSREGQELKKQTTEWYKACSQTPKKIPSMLLLEFKDDL
jgi:hypothetical protein